MVAVDNLRQLVKFLNRRANGNAYAVATEITNIPAGGSRNLHLANPAGSGVELDVEAFVVSSQFRGRYWIYDGFDGDVTGGSNELVDNLRMDSDGDVDDGIAEAKQGVTYTATNTHWPEVLPSGGGTGSGVGTSGGTGVGTEPLIEPGREVVVELQNDSSNDRPGGIGAVYTQADA